MTTTGDISIRMTEANITTANLEYHRSSCLAVSLNFDDIKALSGGVAVEDISLASDKLEAGYTLEDGRRVRVYPPPGWQFGVSEIMDGWEYIALEHLCGKIALLG